MSPISKHLCSIRIAMHIIVPSLHCSLSLSFKKDVFILGCLQCSAWTGKSTEISSGIGWSTYRSKTCTTQEDPNFCKFVDIDKRWPWLKLWQSRLQFKHFHYRQLTLLSVLLVHQVLEHHISPSKAPPSFNLSTTLISQWLKPPLWVCRTFNPRGNIIIMYSSLS